MPRPEYFSESLTQDTSGGARPGALPASALNFHCTLHSSMVGSINGANAPEPPPCNDPYGC